MVQRSNEIVSECLLPTEFGSHCVHVDTTNFSLTGEYESDFNVGEIGITYGYPKDGRWDLKRFVLVTASNQHGVPLFLQTFSGNESDKETIRSIVNALTDNLKSKEKVYHVADSAFYTAENLQSVREHTFWITRVPATISDVTDLEFTPCKDERYSRFECPAEYAGIKQKWVVYHSALMQERQEKTFDTNLEKDLGKVRKSVKQICSPEYACEPDARAAAERWLKKNPRYRFHNCEIMPVRRKPGKCRGRPKTDDPLEISYHPSASVVFNDDAVANERRKLGRFVLATNDLDLSPDTLLMYYKGQSAVERGFRFLKDKSFQVAEIFLKKNSGFRRWQ